MIESVVVLVKIAGLSTLAILAWAGWSARRAGTTAAPAPLSTGAAGPKDRQGAIVLRAFTAMLIVGAVGMFALSVIGIVGDL